MKKLIVIAALLLGGLFNTISAQSVLRWSINTDAGPASLKILIDGSPVVDIVQAQGAPQQSGIITGLNNQQITYYANSTGKLHLFAPELKQI